MRVLHLSSEKSWRGGERQIAYLLDELTDSEAECHVACRKNSAFHEFISEKTMPFVTHSFKSEFDIRTACSIRNYCRKKNIDIIHSHSGRSHGIAVLAELFGAKTTLVVSRRVDFPIKDNNWSRFKYDFPQVKKIICVSGAIEKIVRKSVKKPDRCVTIHSGIDFDLYAESKPEGVLRKNFDVPDDFLLIGNIAAIAPHKDYFTFVDTAAKALANGLKARFFIIGDGPEKQKVNDYIVSGGLGDSIFMTGFLENIHKIMNELDIFLISSKTEGLGTSVLDAFASRTPVVATMAGGIPELVEHEKTGLLAAVGDSTALAVALERMASDRDIRDYIIKNAFEKVRLFSKEKTAQRTLEVYKEVMNQ